VADATSGEATPRASGKELKEEGLGEATEPVAGGDAGVEQKGIAGQPEMADAPGAGVFRQEIEHDGMEMEVVMAIDVVERESRPVEAFELRGQFAAKGIAERRIEEDPEARGGG
jgi:hypothetical protein